MTKLTQTQSDHPVELIRDERGVYGIDGDHNVDGDHHQRLVLLLRSDRLNQAHRAIAVLRMITGGFRHCPFCRTLEEYFRRTIWRPGIGTGRSGLSITTGLPFPFVVTVFRFSDGDDQKPNARRSMCSQRSC
jgi:hypothetical protein